MSSQKPRVVLFGELLLRLTTPLHERFLQAVSFDAAYTGGEANAGALLAGLGTEALLVAAVPDNDLGQACVNAMRRFGLDTRYVQRRGPRLGTLYVELGAGQRPSKVVYDRAGSSFAELKAGDIPWKQILQDADWLHFTGTAPAPSADLRELALEGCTTAKSLGKTVSCDLNYRSTLWPVEQAREVMQQLAPQFDVLIANEEHARLLLDAPAAEFSYTREIFEMEAYRSPTSWLRNQYGIGQVALTIRTGTNSDETTFAAIFDDGQQLYMSRVEQIRVVDRIGAGDAFTGGLIYGLLQHWDPAVTLQFAAAAACLKHSIHGDVCLASLKEVQDLAFGFANARVIR